MPKSCCVVGCTANKIKNPDFLFFTIPSKSRDRIRRKHWIQAIRREETGSVSQSRKLWDPASQYSYVCSQHFVTGHKSNEKSHPDYIPTLLPHRKVSTNTRLNIRERVDKNCCTTALPTSRPTEGENEVPTSTEGENEVPSPTDEQLNREITVLREERDIARRERDEAQRKFKASSLKENDEKCKLMCGVTWSVFNVLHTYISQFIKFSKLTKLFTEDQLYLCLLKLRQNTSTPVLAQMFDIDRTTVLRVFIKWIDIMHTKMSFLIHWPDRECIHSTLPPEMSLRFPRLTSIIDCFEIRIERPKKLKARAKTFSNYKNWTTAKYFIACHPSGSISYLSKGWGGRASDVHIVRHSGFLSATYHHPGDQILADRGFTLKEEFAILGADLIMPAFTKGVKQLPGKQVEESRVKSNIRIHIERVIGLLKGRFHILDGPIPMRLVKNLLDERQQRPEATLDKIVHVCAALVNMSSSVV